MDLYSVVNAVLCGFFGSAAIHYLFQWWQSRSERLLLVFGLFCAVCSLFCPSLILLTHPASVQQAQFALSMRITLGLVANALAFLIFALLVGGRIRIVMPLIVTLLVAAAVGLVVPFVGTVVALQPVSPSQSAPIVRGAQTWVVVFLYITLSAGYAYGLFIARSMWIRDRAGSILVALGAAASFANFAVIGPLIDLAHVPVRYVGAFPQAFFVMVMAMYLAREYGARGAALRESERRFATVFRESRVALAVTECDTERLVAVNPAMQRLVGAGSLEEMLGKSTVELGLWSAATRRERLTEALSPSGGEGVVATIRRLNGEARAVEFWASSYDIDGREHLLVSVVDIADRVNLEEQLRQAQKMEAVGRLAGGIAHDFNNLLTVIIGSGELALGRLDRQCPEASEVQEMVKAADRAAELTRQLLAFGRRQVLAPRELDLNWVLADMDKMLQRLLGDDVTLDTVHGADLWAIRADQGQLEQVIANLVVNARDAMSRGGTLTLATSNVELDESFIAAHPGAKCGSHVKLTVSDTGSGMTPEIQSKIFEPFFTTKGPGKGTGLGLATVLGIVQQSDGYIRVSSLPGQGTTFDLFFPRVATIALNRTIEPFRPVLPAGTETLLVVEDNDVLRDLTTRALRSGGYTVLHAAGGEEALDLAGRHAGSIDLLVSDVVLPGMSGRALADGLARERPGLKVLFVSGYPDDVLGGYGLRSAELNLLLKPFTPSRLRTKVREVIDGYQKEPALH